MSRFAMGGDSTIRIVQHDTSVETRVMGFDHTPYSATHAGVPDAVVDAIRTGFGLTQPEFDARLIDWSE